MRNFYSNATIIPEKPFEEEEGKKTTFIKNKSIHVGGSQKTEPEILRKLFNYNFQVS